MIFVKLEARPYIIDKLKSLFFNNKNIRVYNGKKFILESKIIKFDKK